MVINKNHSSVFDNCWTEVAVSLLSSQSKSRLFMDQLLDPIIIYAIPFFIVMMALELYIGYKEHLDLYETKDSIACLTMGIGSVFIGAGMKALALMLYSAIYQYRLFEIGWTWWAWVILLFADDFTFYWHHRLSHEVRLLWAAHVNHHSSQRYNFAVALRQSWSELLYKYFWWIWLPFIGFHPLMVLMMQSVSLIYQFLLHTQTVKKLGFLEWFMNTPSHHRVHHSVNIPYLDRNHAGILIIWDKIFGTFQREEELIEPPVFGITSNINTFNPLKIATHEFSSLWKDMKTAATWKDSLRYAIYPPGWSPEGPNRTSRYLQKQLLKHHSPALKS